MFKYELIKMICDIFVVNTCMDVEMYIYTILPSIKIKRTKLLKHISVSKTNSNARIDMNHFYQKTNHSYPIRTSHSITLIVHDNCLHNEITCLMLFISQWDMAYHNRLLTHCTNVLVYATSSGYIHILRCKFPWDADICVHIRA